MTVMRVRRWIATKLRTLADRLDPIQPLTFTFNDRYERYLRDDPERTER